MAKTDTAELLQVGEQTVRISHPEKLYFSRAVRLTKLDIVRYFLAVAPGALRGIQDRPVVLKRFVNGAEAEPFYQKRAPGDLPPWMRTVTLSFPSGRTAEEVVVDDAAGLAWIANLGCMELHPHPVRSGDLEHPDELRVDLDPGPGVPWEYVREVAQVAREVLTSHGLTGFVKTSGSRGIHIYAPIHPQWSFAEVRRAALALAREVERRAPTLASSKWWKEERHGVFLDYNQNAKDRTTASAYSVRPLPDARVSAPLTWEELPSCEPGDFTVLTMPARFDRLGDPHFGMADHAGSLEALLDLAARDAANGLADAPWPPHFAKAEGEGPRVAPSRARSATKDTAPKAGKDFTDQLGEGFGEKRFRRGRAKQASSEASATEPVEAEKPPVKERRGRQSRMPLLIISQSPDQGAAMAGLERWKQQHPQAAALLAIDDILVDRMRGTAYVWYRVRVNLRHVPEDQRPPQATPDPDDDPTRKWKEAKAHTQSTETDGSD